MPGCGDAPACGAGFSESTPPTALQSPRSTANLLPLLLFLALAAAAPAYELYYGNLHSHTSYSTGASVPRHAFAYARDTAHIDVLAVTDHSVMLSDSEWNDTKAQADSATVPDSFVGLAGFEWTSPTYGHANVLNSVDRTSILRHPTPELLYEWLATEPQARAQFNHPTAGNFRAFAYSQTGDQSFVMYEMQDTSYAASYDVALDSGWHASMSANQDNHGGNWGAAERLTGIWAGALARDSILAALSQMRTFGTLNRNAWLRFKAGDAWMGSTVANGQIEFDIVVADPDSEDTILRVELVSNGGVVVESLLPGDTNYVEWQPVVDTDSGAHRYFFVRAVIKDTALVVSAPIWTEPSMALQQRGDRIRPVRSIRVHPNPFVSAVELRPDAPGFGTLAIYNAAGSQVRRFAAGLSGTWDGRDDRGQELPAGAYVACWTEGRRRSTVSLLRLSPH